jgi:hypothetical protein
LPSFDSSRLAERGRYGLNWWKLLRMLPRQLIGLQGAKQFMQRKPTPLAPHTARPAHEEPPIHFPSAASYVFSVDETIRLRQTAQSRNVMTNEMLARNLFLAIFCWQRLRGCIDECNWLRMMVPVDLRSVEDRMLPAANVVSSIFLDRRGEDAADPETLLESIHKEMELIKRNQLGFTMLFSLRLFQWLPGGIRKSVRTDRCTVSCIFTNLGKIFVRTPLPKRGGRLVAGDVTLDSLQLLVPLRPYNCAAFCVHQYAGKLVVDLHFDPDVLTREDAAHILEIFANQSVTMTANSLVETVP